MKNLRKFIVIVVISIIIVAVVIYNLFKVFNSGASSISPAVFTPIITVVVMGFMFYKFRSLFFGSTPKIDEEYAVQTVGIIRSVDQTGVYLNRVPQVKITFDLILQDYTTTQAELLKVVPLTEIGNIQIGAYWPLVYDARDNTKVMLNEQMEPEEINHILSAYNSKGNPYAPTIEELKALKERGIVATAIVKDMQTTNEIIEGNPVVVVTIQLQQEIEGFSSSLSRPVVMSDIVAKQIMIGKYIRVQLLKEKPNSFMLQLSLQP